MGLLMANPLFNPSRFRLLDYDDFLILRALSEGKTVNEAGKVLGVTQPAVSQRLRKISFVFGEENVMTYHGRNASLTPAGVECAKMAIEVLAIIDRLAIPAKTS